MAILSFMNPVNVWSIGADGSILSVTDLSESLSKGKWNTITIPVASSIPYGKELYVSIKASLQSEQKPVYYAVNLQAENGKTGFLKLEKNGVDDNFEAVAVMAKVQVSADSPVKEPWSDADKITGIKVYARFESAVSSRFSIREFLITTTKPMPPLSTSRAKLFQGKFTLLPEMRGVHPRLLASASDLEKIAGAYQNNPATLARYLVPLDSEAMTSSPMAFGENDRSAGNALSLAQIAVCYRITKKQEYLSRLRAWKPALEAFQPVAFPTTSSNNSLTAGHLLMGLSIAYDVIEGQGEKEFESALRAALIRQGMQTYKDLQEVPFYPFEQNHLSIPVAGLGLAAMTLADQIPDAAAWGVAATNILDIGLEALGKDGWFFEGVGYWQYTMQFPTPYAVALKRTVGQNRLDRPVFKDSTAYLAHMFLPGGTYAFDFADWGPRTNPDGTAQPGYDQPWHSLPTRLFAGTAILIYSETKDPFLKDFIDWIGPRSPASRSDAIFGLVTGTTIPDAPVPMKSSYQDYRPYHYFSDCEVIHWRNNWSDPNATAIAFKSGPPAGHGLTALLPQYPEWRPALGHAHPDAGSFLLFSKGFFLTNDTGYVGKKETADHNCLLVDGQGQDRSGTAWSTFEAKPYSEYNKIRMEDVWLGSRVAAGTAVLEAAYADSLRIEKMRRNLILIDGRFMVVRDTIDSKLPHEYEWRLHSDREAKAIRPGRYVMQNGAGQLIVQSLLPIASETVSPTIVETEIYRKGVSRPQQRGFHISVKSPQSNHFKFLTVFGIQSSNEKEEVFEVKNLERGGISFSDSTAKCIVWLEGDRNLSGKFGYALRLDGKELSSIGLFGTKLQGDNFQLSLKRPGRVILQRKEDGLWRIESTEISIEDIELRIGNGAMPVRLTQA